MTHDNNVSIGSVGTGNTIHISQNQTPSAPHIEYEIIPNSIEHVPSRDAYRDALGFYGSLSLPILGIVADGVGVLSFLGLQTKWVLAVCYL
jgi:hypothetical protein